MRSKPTYQTLANAYGVSRQRVHQLAEVWGRAVVSDPEQLARVLTAANAKRRPLTVMLADPAERARLTAEIKSLSI